jgi:hypothetical protein
MMQSADLGVEQLANLKSVERRVHWLAMRMVDAANHDRSTPQGRRSAVTRRLRHQWSQS